MTKIPDCDLFFRIEPLKIDLAIKRNVSFPKKGNCGDCVKPIQLHEQPSSFDYIILDKPSGTLHNTGQC
jgi:hypothetical protein